MSAQHVAAGSPPRPRSDLGPQRPGSARAAASARPRPAGPPGTQTHPEAPGQVRRGPEPRASGRSGRRGHRAQPAPPGSRDPDGRALAAVRPWSRRWPGDRAAPSREPARHGAQVSPREPGTFRGPSPPGPRRCPLPARSPRRSPRPPAARAPSPPTPRASSRDPQAAAPARSPRRGARGGATAHPEATSREPRPQGR